MDIQDYLSQRKDVQRALLQFLDQEEDIEEDYQNFINIIIHKKIQENPYDLKEILNLIVKIADDHQRNSTFFSKIEKILLYFKDSIKKFYFNSDIYNIFRSNKRIILFLFKSEIVIPDEYIAHSINREEYKNKNYFEYFYPEFRNFKEFQDEKRKEEDHELFEEKRKKGENEEHICHLIRNDAIDEFISYINQKDFYLKQKIKKSIFETNSFLIDKTPNLLEYAAFFGSIQIFRYLYLNDVDNEMITESIWSYAIHGNSQEVINYLEQKNIHPENESFHKCLTESIKCHNIDMTNYIVDNFYQNERDILEKMAYRFQAFQYYNFELFPNVLNVKLYIDKICTQNYVYILDLILKSVAINYDLIEILNVFYFE